MSRGVLAVFIAILMSLAVCSCGSVPQDHGHPDSEGDAKALLNELGCSRWFVASLVRHLPVISLFIAVVVMLASSFAKQRNQRRSRFDIGTLLVVLGLVLALSQWRASLEEGAMQKYETEIAEANKAALASVSVHEMMAPLYPSPAGKKDVNAGREYEKVQYVYVQLDNLEYALERYVHGLSSAYTAARAVMTFRSLCKSEEFRQRVRCQLAAASYSPTVHRVVDSLLRTYLGPPTPCLS